MNTDHDIGTDSAKPLDVSTSSIGELLSEVTHDMSTLIRQEVELAKAEVRQEATKASKAAGMLGSAGIAGYMVVLFLSFALWWGLSNIMDHSWAAVIVAVLWAIIGAILFAVGRTRLRQVGGLRRTTETVKEIPDAIKGHK